MAITMTRTTIKEENKIKCEKCGKTMDEKQFYTYKDGKKTELCKKCLTMHINSFDPETFTWILKKLDFPYIEGEWNNLRNEEFAKHPNNVNHMSVFGKYISKMRLAQWKDYTWEDTDKLKEEIQGKETQKQIEREEFEKEALRRLNNGEITEFEYKTLTSTETQKSLLEENYNSNINNNNNNNNNESMFMKEEDLPNFAEDLTEEDKTYLAMKWGRYYKPHEWVTLENKYVEMEESFGVQDSDTRGTLILICKTYLKMNQAIDAGDLDGYQKLSRVYESLRKSSKFTAAQNSKEEKKDFVNSVGQLVAYCEKEGGKIPKFNLKFDLDIVDKVIKDLKEYNKSLIYEDVSLARQIEDYLKKKEIAEMNKVERKKAKEHGIEYELTDEDINEYNKMKEEQSKEDFERLEKEKENEVLKNELRKFNKIIKK